ncbi:unnamed protein product [Urochloa humidicola]
MAILSSSSDVTRRAVDSAVPAWIRRPQHPSSAAVAPVHSFSRPFLTPLGASNPPPSAAAAGSPVHRRHNPSRSRIPCLPVGCLTGARFPLTEAPPPQVLLI